MVVSTLGDLLVDVIVHVDGPIAADTDTFCEIDLTAGGQAANVAAWVSELGHDGQLICTRGNDAAGALAATELEQHGVEIVGPIVGARTGTVVSLARGDGTRSMLTDRGGAVAFDVIVDRAWLDRSEWLHVSGYALAADPLRSTALQAASIAAEIGCRVSVDLASSRVIEDVGAASFVGLLMQLAPQLAFGNEAEYAALELEPADEQGTTTWVVKRGGDGATVYTEASQRSYKAKRTTVVDATGAGDAFAAGYLAGGIETALTAAARCVANNGAMP